MTSLRSFVPACVGALFVLSACLGSCSSREFDDGNGGDSSADDAGGALDAGGASDSSAGGTGTGGDSATGGGSACDDPECAPRLLDLVLGAGDLVPEFEEDEGEYALRVSIHTQTVELTPTAPAGTTITIGKSEIESGEAWTSALLQLGKTEITITVSRDGWDDSTYVVEVTRGDLDGYVKAENIEQKAGFARSVALSGDGKTLAVGAPYEDWVWTNPDDQEEGGNGSVYVFVRSDSGWTQQAQIKAPNANNRDFFGSAVDLDEDGNTLVVGAYREDSAARTVNGDGTSNTASEAGAAYVFVRSSGVWQHQAYLKASNADTEDWFGFAVAVSADGRTIVVGAPWERGASNTFYSSGAAYVFAWNAGAWGQQAYLQASSPDSYDYFGWSLDISTYGDVVAVGAWGEASSANGVNGDETNDTMTEAGAVFIFERSNLDWYKQAYLKASNTQAQDRFGRQLRLSQDGRTLVVGAPNEDSNATGANGDESNNALADSGAVYVFTRPSSTWSQQAYLKAAAPNASDLFGSALAISADGTTLLVGASEEDGSGSSFGGDPTSNSVANSGATYFFERQEAAWSQQGYLKAPKAIAYDGFGSNLAISAEGESFAVTSLFVNGSSTNAVGATYLYR